MYHIVKFPHPSSNEGPSIIRNVKTEEEAQAICSQPDSSYKLGPMSEWYFLGYTKAVEATGG